MSNLERDRLNAVTWFLGGLFVVFVLVTWSFTDRIIALEDAVYALAAQQAERSPSAIEQRGE